MFRQLTEDMKERLELIDAKYSIENFQKFLSEGDPEDFNYIFKLGEFMMEASSEKMMVYILENYEKVPLEVWNKKTFSIIPHLGKDNMYFGKEDEYVKKWKIASMEKRAEERWKRTAKITEISFILDESDGDFSVNFNDGAWCFIDGQDVLEYYNVINRYLNKKNVK